MCTHCMFFECKCRCLSMCYPCDRSQIALISSLSSITQGFGVCYNKSVECCWSQINASGTMQNGHNKENRRKQEQIPLKPTTHGRILDPWLISSSIQQTEINQKIFQIVVDNRFAQAITNIILNFQNVLDLKHTCRTTTQVLYKH